MPNIPTYQYKVPLRDAPDVEQSLNTDTSMFGGNEANALKAWGGAFDKMGDAAETYAAAEKKKSDAEVLYGGSDKAQDQAAKTPDPYVSDRDWDYVASIRDDLDKAKADNDSAKFREAITRVGGTLQSYPNLEPHLPKGAAQAWRDYRTTIDDDERQNFTAKGLSSTPDDRDRMAQAAAAKVLGGWIQAATQAPRPAVQARPVPRTSTDASDGPVVPMLKGMQFRGAGTQELLTGGAGDDTLVGGEGNDALKGQNDRQEPRPAQRVELKPTREFVNPYSMLDALEFSEDGDGHGRVLLKNPRMALRAKSLRNSTDEDVLREYPFVTDRRNNEADALRHSLWSYRVAKEFGTDAAKWLGDSHERHEPNDIEERLMDLFNNNVGRQLALDPRNRDRPDVEVIQEAIRNGIIQTQPFRVRQPPTAPFDTPSLPSYFRR